MGASVIDIDPDRLLNDASLPEWILGALDAHGALVFRGLHIDDAAQVAFSKRLGRVVVLGRGENPEIFRVTLDPAKNPAAEYLRGTFDWHIDGCTDDVPIMATLLSAHTVAASGGETEFASTYAAYEDLSEEEKERYLSLRVVHTIEASQRLVNRDPSPEEVAIWRSRPSKEHPLVWTHQSGRRSLVLGATASHVVGLDLDEGRALLDDLLDRSTTPGADLPAPVAGGRSGDLGQSRRAAPGLPLRRRVSPGHAPHDPARRRADPVSFERVAIVTGGASGIGFAISERLAADGNAVAIFDRDGDAAEVAAAKIAASGGDAVGLRVDVTDRAQIDNGVVEVRERFGRPTILVNSAGLDGFDRFLYITPEKWSRILAVNLTGTFNCCQAVVPDMVEEGWGRIVNISSSSAHGGQPLMTHYVAAKAGVIGFTKALALEFGPKGITVNTIPPGFIDTPMLRGVRAQGPPGRGGRVPRRAHARAPRRPPRGHRGDVRLPRPRRGRLHHRAGHRRQRRPEHLRWPGFSRCRPGSGRRRCGRRSPLCAPPTPATPFRRPRIVPRP